MVKAGDSSRLCDLWEGEKENGKKSKKGIDILGRWWYSNQAVSAVRVTAKQTVEKTA